MFAVSTILGILALRKGHKWIGLFFLAMAFASNPHGALISLVGIWLAVRLLKATGWLVKLPFRSVRWLWRG